MSFRKKSAEQTWNGFRYSADESVHSQAFRGLIPRLVTEGNNIKKNQFYKKFCSSIHNVFLQGRFREFISILFPQNGIPSCFLFHGMVRNRIPSFCFYFCSTEWNSELFFVFGMVQNGIPRVCFYCCSMVQNFEHFSLLRNGSERNFESFLFRGTTGIPLERTNCSVYSVFRSLMFLSEIGNPTYKTRMGGGGGEEKNKRNK